MTEETITLLDFLDEVKDTAYERLGLNETDSDKFNFATISKTESGIDYIEYWLLINAYYDESLERFIKMDATATSFGIQMQAKGTYPGEADLGYTNNTGVNIWRNPRKADVYKDTTTYDYTDYDDNNYIGAERRSDNVWVEFGLSSGWSNNLMTDSYGGVTVGGNGIEIDGAGIFPFGRVTNSSFNDGTNTYYILGMLDNAYHPNGTTWKCDSNEYEAWFFGFKYPQTSGAKDSSNAKFVVLYNDMSSIDPTSQGYTIEDMDINDWKTVLEVGSSGSKAMINGVLTPLNTSDISIVKQATAETGYAATYVLYQGDTALSPKINIPKDFLLKSASIETCTVDDEPVEGYVVGDKYFDFVINTIDSDETASHIYLKVTEIGGEIYTADNTTLVLSNENVFSIKDGGVTFAKIASAAIGTGASQIAAGNHNHSGTYAPATHNQDLSTINNTSTLQVTITYTDDTTETKNLVVYTPPATP